MTSDPALKSSVGLIAAVAVSVAAYQAESVFAPLTLALFIIALVWPLQDWLQARMPALLALAITMTVTIVVMLAFASLVVWGFGRVGRSVDRRFRPLPGDLRGRGRLAGGPRRFGRRPVGGALQFRLDAALGAADHRAASTRR